MPAEYVSCHAAVQIRQRLGVQDEAKRMEALMTKRTALQAKRADLEKAIRELGTLPADAFQKYREESIANLHKRLSKAQAKLKTYGWAQ